MYFFLLIFLNSYFKSSLFISGDQGLRCSIQGSIHPAPNSPKERHRCVRQGGKWERKILNPSRGISGGRKQRLELALGQDVGVKNPPSCQGDLVGIARCTQYPAALPEEDRARLACFVDGLQLIAKQERSPCCTSRSSTPPLQVSIPHRSSSAPSYVRIPDTKGARRGRLPAQHNGTGPRKGDVGRLQLRVGWLQVKGLK